MKKILLGLLIVALVLGLTACSPESYKELAEKMGGMKDNVFGIEANMADVDKATEKVGASVAVQKDEEGNVTGATIDFSAAAKITESVASIKDSEQKTEALKEELAKPVAATVEEQTAIQTALQNQADTLAAAFNEIITNNSSAPEAEQLSAEQIELITTVQEALSSITISENPTMAELTTVAVLTEMANTVQEVAAAEDTSTYFNEGGLTEEGLKVADTALSSLDTLKMTSEVAGMDLLGDVDILTMLNSLTGGGSKGLSLSAEEQELLNGFSVPVQTLVGLFTKDGKFDEAKYNSFIAQSKAVKLTYDLLSAAYAKPKTIAGCDALLTVKTKHGLTVDDLLRYLIAMTFVTFDRALERDSNGDLVDVNPLKTFIETEGIYDALMDIGTKYEVLANAEVDGFGDVWASLEKTLKADESGNYDSYALRCISTLAILLVDSGYSGYLKLGNESGTISGYLNQL